MRLDPFPVELPVTCYPRPNSGAANERGAIEVGKLADIIVIDGDPWFDIMALDDPVLVVKDGRPYRR